MHVVYRYVHMIQMYHNHFHFCTFIPVLWNACKRRDLEGRTFCCTRSTTLCILLPPGLQHEVLVHGTASAIWAWKWPLCGHVGYSASMSAWSVYHGSLSRKANKLIQTFSSQLMQDLPRSGWWQWQISRQQMESKLPIDTISCSGRKNLGIEYRGWFGLINQIPLTNRKQIVKRLWYLAY